MREFWINIGLIVLAAVVFSIPVWLPRWARWLDARRVRRLAAKRDPFPAVHMADDGDGPTIIPLSSRRGRQECRRAYRGRP